MCTPRIDSWSQGPISTSNRCLFSPLLFNFIVRLVIWHRCATRRPQKKILKILREILLCWPKCLLIMAGRGSVHMAFLCRLHDDEILVVFCACIERHYKGRGMNLWCRLEEVGGGWSRGKTIAYLFYRQCNVSIVSVFVLLRAKCIFLKTPVWVLKRAMKTPLRGVQNCSLSFAVVMITLTLDWGYVMSIFLYLGVTLCECFVRENYVFWKRRSCQKCVKRLVSLKINGCVSI